MAIMPAFQYTVTVSQNFTIPELFAMKNFMYKHDARCLLQMTHQRFEQTKLKQWQHSEKGDSYCEVCKAKSLILTNVEIIKN